MYALDHCPCCGATELRLHHARVSPFVTALCLAGRPPPCHLAECTRCGHRFFDLRLEAAELGKIYADYRGDTYFAARHAVEPWYTRAVNDGLGAEGGRAEALRAWLAARLPVAEVGAVLDYGGDRGQHIPKDLGRERFVYEVSNATPAPGVVRIAEPSALAGRRFDLVLLAHVLEHVSDPAAFLEEVLAIEHRWLYVELPLERPRLSPRLTSAAQRRWLDTVTRSRVATIGLDFVSTVARLKLDRVPAFALLKLHEHQNAFSEGSLRALLEGRGLGVIALAIDGSVIRALAAR